MTLVKSSSGKVPEAGLDPDPEYVQVPVAVAPETRVSKSKT